MCHIPIHSGFRQNDLKVVASLTFSYQLVGTYMQELKTIFIDFRMTVIDGYMYLNSMIHSKLQMRIL